MKNISYHNDELLKNLFSKLPLESPSPGFTDRIMDLLEQPEVDMSAHQQTINKLIWTFIVSIAVIIPVLFFLLDWSVFDLFPNKITAERFKYFVDLISSLPNYFSSFTDGLKQYSLFFIVMAAGLGLLFFDSLLNKSLMRSLFHFTFAGTDVK
jgi:ABC-type amino acid transport system permease subunit